jgi:hypothetical protein
VFHGFNVLRLARDSCCAAGSFERSIHTLFPLCSDVFYFFRSALSVIERPGFLAEFAGGIDRARGYHDVRVRVARVAVFRSSVNRPCSRDAVSVSEIRSKASHEPSVLLCIQFCRQRYHYLSRRA